MILSDITKAQIISFLLQHGAKEVFLFGSQLSGKINEKSDIDIGVKGLPPESFFSVMYEIEDIAKSKVDLVNFDTSERFYNHLLETNSVQKIGGAA